MYTHLISLNMDVIDTQFTPQKIKKMNTYTFCTSQTMMVQHTIMHGLKISVVVCQILMDMIIKDIIV